MFNSQKFILISAAALALMVAAWASYFLGYDQGKKAPKTTTATESSQPVASGSGSFTLVARDDLFDLRKEDGTGVATGKIKSVTSDTISLTNNRGDQTGFFKINSETNYMVIKNSQLTQEGSLSDLKVGMLVQISFQDDNNDHLARLVIR